ncbi:MAG: laccase domain-containing protein, partial [Pseudomonadota bacterium]|nr:laccase domain-containing protein [Pseudomonadota bacterium]
MTTPPFLTDALLTPTRHGFFGRQGGVSSGLYESLNVGLASNDRKENITINRQRVAKSLNARSLITGYQTHSNKVSEVLTANDKPEADALFTKE